MGNLVELIADAFAQSPATVLDEIARTAATGKGVESDPTRETILSYIKDPKRMIVRGKVINRRNRLTPIHQKFAHLAINYLDGRRPDQKRIDVPPETADSLSWREARRLCKQVLQAERDKRFERPLGSDPGMQMEISRVAGVYALCRRETSDARYHQELLILRNSGTRRAPRCYCTYVSEHVVTRGEWMIAGHVVYCGMTGYRDDNSHEIGGLYLAHLTDHDMLTGFLAGAGTDVKIPVLMPVVAVKVAEASRSILELGDLGDEAILRAFRRINSDLSNVSAKLEAILEGQIKPVVFHASVSNPALRAAFGAGQLLVHQRFRDFCKDSFV